MCRVLLPLLVATHFVFLSAVAFAAPYVVQEIQPGGSSHGARGGEGTSRPPPAVKTDAPFAIAESPRQEEGATQAPSTTQAPSEASSAAKSTNTTSAGKAGTPSRSVRTGVRAAPVNRVPADTGAPPDKAAKP